LAGLLEEDGDFVLEGGADEEDESLGDLNELIDNIEENDD